MRQDAHLDLGERKGEQMKHIKYNQDQYTLLCQLDTIPIISVFIISVTKRKYASVAIVMARA